MRAPIGAVLVLVGLLMAQAAGAVNQHQLWVGTGEYDPAAAWDAILYYEKAETINGNRSPDVTVDFGSKGGNFPHMLAYRSSTDELYVTSLFTDEIFVFPNARHLTPGSTPSRVISGGATSLYEPHGLWIDETNDTLYVANRFNALGGLSGTVTAWKNASTVNGNVHPDRVIGGSLTGLAQPFNVFVDETNDRLYVASANEGPAGPDPAIVIFDNASTKNGNVPFTRKIAGPLTTFFSHLTVHNVFLDPIRDEFYVAHHQSDILVFGPASTINGNVSPTRTLSGFDNALGFFYLPAEDVLYVSDANASCGSGAGGAPCPGAPPQAIKVFYNASTLSGSVGGSPDRVIYWEPEAATYFPPQPLWVHSTTLVPALERGNWVVLVLLVAGVSVLALRWRRAHVA